MILIKRLGDFFKFRKKKTATEMLDDLEKNIKHLELKKQQIQINRRTYMFNIMCGLIGLYLFCAVVFYLYFIPQNLTDLAICVLPFLITPIVIYFVKRFLSWYYHNQFVYYENKLNICKEEKKKIIEDVKEKETYKKASEILAKYSLDSNDLAGKKPVITSNQPQQPQVQLKQATQQNSNNNLNGVINRNLSNSQQQQQLLKSQLVATATSNYTNNGQTTQTLLPRPILPQTRSAIEKIVDFCIGDGPINRYALICKNCSSHNGMALKEEFEFIAFRCAYCFQFNPSRKTKLKVPYEKSSSNTQLTDSSSSSSAAAASPTTTKEQQPSPNDCGDNDDDDQNRSLNDDKKLLNEKKNE